MNEENYLLSRVPDIAGIIFKFLQISEGINFLYEIYNVQYRTLISKIKLRIDSFYDLSIVSKLTDLIHLDINFKNMFDLEPLRSLLNLKYLVLSNLEDISDTNISVLKYLTNLEHLTIYKCYNRLSCIKYLTGLKSLSLDVCLKVDDLEYLTKLTQFTCLNLRLCPKIKNISLLKSYMYVSNFSYSDLLVQYPICTWLGYIHNGEKIFQRIEKSNGKCIKFKKQYAKNMDHTELIFLANNLSKNLLPNKFLNKDKIIDLIWDMLSYTGNILYFSPIQSMNSLRLY